MSVATEQEKPIRTVQRLVAQLVVAVAVERVENKRLLWRIYHADVAKLVDEEAVND
jgi:hypothetical protein